MIKHIVMFKLKEYNNNIEKLETAKKVKLNFESLIGKINEIVSYEVGINISTSPASFDVVINSDFNNIEELKKYTDHPEHRKAVKYNKQFSVEKVVVDYEY